MLGNGMTELISYVSEKGSEAKMQVGQKTSRILL